jgi:hypothetical protein
MVEIAVEYRIVTHYRFKNETHAHFMEQYRKCQVNNSTPKSAIEGFEINASRISSN